MGGAVRRVVRVLAACALGLVLAPVASAAVAPTLIAFPVTSAAVPTNGAAVTISWAFNPLNTSYAVTSCAAPPAAGVTVGPLPGTTLSTAVAAEGASCIQVTAFDALLTRAASQITVYIDRTAPVVVFSAPDAGLITNAPIPVVATAAATGGAAVTFTATGPGAAAAAIAATPWTPPGQGVYAITGRSVDPAGNAGTATRSVTYDSVDPTGGITAPAVNAIVNAPFQLASNIDDAVSGVDHVTFRCNRDCLPGGGRDIVVNGAPWNANDVTLVDGTYTIQAIAVDTANNQMTTAARALRVDMHAPSAPELSGLAAVVGAPALSWTASSDPAGGLGLGHYEVYRGSAKIGSDIAAGAARTYTDAGAPDGAVSSYTVRAVDVAGNVTSSNALAVRRDSSAQSAARTVTAKAYTTTAPALTWVAPPTSAIAANRYEIYRNAARVATVPTLSYTDTGIAEGAYDYQVVPLDAANTAGVASKPVHVVVDRTDPVGSGIFGASPNADGSITFAWAVAVDAGSGIDGYQVRRIAGVAPPATLASGDPVCDATAPALTCRDAAANASGSSFALFAIDRAGNSTRIGQLTGAQVRDRVPPSSPQRLRIQRGRSVQAVPFEQVAVRWKNPKISDFLRVVLVRNTKRPPRTRTDGKVVYGSNGTLARVRIEAGRTTYLALFALDRAGNVSKPVRTQVVLPALSLLRPLAGSQYPVGSPIGLSWPPVEGADYYNVQIYLRGKKIATVWPTSNKLTYATLGLAPGIYVWYVWPASEVNGQTSFGSVIGRSTFELTAPAP